MEILVLRTAIASFAPKRTRQRPTSLIRLTIFRQSGLKITALQAARKETWRPARKLAGRRAPPLVNPHLNPSMQFRNQIARDTGGMRMSPAADALELISSP